MLLTQVERTNFRAKKPKEVKIFGSYLLDLVEDRIIGECKSIKVTRPVTSLDEMARSERK